MRFYKKNGPNLSLLFYSRHSAHCAHARRFIMLGMACLHLMMMQVFYSFMDTIAN